MTRSDRLLSGWLGDMAGSLEARIEADATSWRIAGEGVRRVQVQIETWADGVDAALAAEAEVSAQARKEEVKVLVRQRAFGALTRRQLRIAASLMFEFSPDVLRALLVVRRDFGPLILDAFCHHWTDQRGHRRRTELAQVVAAANPHARLLQPAFCVDLMDAECPSRLGHDIELHQLFVLLLQTLYCKPRWQFSAEAVAAWLADYVARHGAKAAWMQAKPQARFVGSILPALRDGAWAPEWPAGGGTAPLPTQVTVVCAMLRAFLRTGDDVSSAFTNRLLRSSTSFPDPRTSTSDGWGLVKKVEPQLFEQLMQRLVTADLELFFRHAMKAKDREDFWLTYLGSIRRTVAVLARETRAKLEQALRRQSRQDGQKGGVLERTCSVPNGRLNAFCLFFDRLVIVEFSDENNAAYVYAKAHFEKTIFSGGASLQKAEDLKDSSAAGRIVHRGNWQEAASELLQSYGIVPSPRKQ